MTRPSGDMAPSGSAVGEMGEGPRAVGTFGHAHMHLVAGEGHAVGGLAVDRLEPLVSDKRRLDVEQAEAFGAMPARPRCRPDREGRGPASDSRRKDRAPCRRGEDAPRGRCRSPASRNAARSAMVAFEPGRMTSAASPGSAVPGLTRTSSTDGLGLERIEIVEIGDMRQDRHRDLDAARPSWQDAPRESARASSAGRSRASGKNGNEAERLPSRRRGDQLHAAA